MIKCFPHDTRHVRIMGKQMKVRVLNIWIREYTCGSMLYIFWKVGLAGCACKIIRNIRQPPTTLENPSNVICLPNPWVSLGFCFKNPQFCSKVFVSKNHTRPSFFQKLWESIFEKALFKTNQKSFKTLMGFVPKLRVWFVPKSPNLGFVPKVPKFLISSPSKPPNLGFLSKVPKLPVCGPPNSQGWFTGP